ncbi:MAG: prepilin-type N-terminal cleavage/methylation domain-containing protein [Bacteroidota bacterium]
MAGLKAFSLIESMVAMVILSIAFSGGTMIYLSVLKSQNIGERVNAIRLISEIEAETLSTQAYFDKAWEMENMHLKRSVKQTRTNPNLLHLSIEAADHNGTKLIQIDNFIIVER